MSSTDLPQDPTAEATAPDVADVPADVRERHGALAEEIRGHQFRYYVLDSPIVSDGQFDALLGDLQAIEDEYPALVTPDSPTQNVGGTFSTEFTAHNHLERMLSLDNVFDHDEFLSWVERVEKEIGSTEYLSELKIDGLAINLLYEDGKLTAGSPAAMAASVRTSLSTSAPWNRFRTS